MADTSPPLPSLIFLFVDFFFNFGFGGFDVKADFILATKPVGLYDSEESSSHFSVTTVCILSPFDLDLTVLLEVAFCLVERVDRWDVEEAFGEVTVDAGPFGGMVAAVALEETALGAREEVTGDLGASRLDSFLRVARVRILGGLGALADGLLLIDLVQGMSDESDDRNEWQLL